MMNPEPAPWRGRSKSRGDSGGPSPRRKNRGRSCVSLPLDMESIFTTAAFMRSTTSAKLTTAGPIEMPAGRMASPFRVKPRGAVATIDVGVNSPAMMRPTRNATTVESAIVTNVKRFDIAALLLITHAIRHSRQQYPLFHYKRLEFRLAEGRYRERTSLLELGTRVGADDEIRRLFADRARDFSAEPLDRRLGVLASHGFERSGQDECLSGQPARCDRRRVGLSCGRVDAGCRKLRDQRTIVRLVRKRPNRRGQHGTYIRHCLQGFERCLQHSAHRPQMPRQGRGRLLAHMADAKCVDESGKIVVLAARNLFVHVPPDLAELSRHR